MTVKCAVQQNGGCVLQDHCCLREREREKKKKTRKLNLENGFIPFKLKYSVDVWKAVSHVYTLSDFGAV